MTVIEDKIENSKVKLKILTSITIVEVMSALTNFHKN